MIARFASSTTASAGAEFALLLPMLVVLLFGGSEAGHFVWTQHKLAEAVRDGARYASRLKADGVDGVCKEGAVNLSPDQLADIRLVTITGQLADRTALTDPTYRRVVPGWTADQVDVKISCGAFVDTGIYTDLGAPGPVVTVSAINVAYPSLFNGLAMLGGNVRLSAKSNAVVIGI